MQILIESINFNVVMAIKTYTLQLLFLVGFDPLILLSKVNKCRPPSGLGVCRLSNGWLLVRIFDEFVRYHTDSRPQTRKQETPLR